MDGWVDGCEVITEFVIRGEAIYEACISCKTQKHLC